MWKVAAAVHYSFDAHGLSDQAEQNDIAAHHRQPCAFANFRAKLVGERVLRDAVNLLLDFQDERHSSLWAILGYKLRDAF